jgi:putative transposase
LRGAYPGDIYTPLARLYAPPSEPETPFHDSSVRVSGWGRICLRKRRINLSRIFAGQIVGICEVDDQIWLFSFLDFDLGFFDREDGRVEPAPNSFGLEKASTMSPE